MHTCWDLSFGHKNTQVPGRKFDARTFLSKKLVLTRSTTKIPERNVFLGGILGRTDFSEGFLPRCVLEIFPRKVLTIKTGLLYRILVRSRWVLGFLV